MKRTHPYARPARPRLKPTADDDPQMIVWGNVFRGLCCLLALCAFFCALALWAPPVP